MFVWKLYALPYFFLLNFWARWLMSAKIDEVVSVSRISNIYRLYENHQIDRGGRTKINVSADGKPAAWFQVICSVRPDLNWAASWCTALNQLEVMLPFDKLMGSTAGFKNSSVIAPSCGQRKPGLCSADVKLCRMRMQDKWFAPDLEVPQLNDPENWAL